MRKRLKGNVAGHSGPVSKYGVNSSGNPVFSSFSGCPLTTCGHDDTDNINFETGSIVFIASLLILFLFPLAAFAGIPIKEIEVNGLSSIQKDELIYLLCLEGKEELDPAALRQGLHRAFSKGIFDYIAVEEDEEVKGLIRITVIEKDVIREVDFEGNENLSARLLARNFALSERQFMRYDRIEEARRGLKEALAQLGYPEAQIDIGTRKKGRYGVIVTVRIKEGNPAIVRSISVIGRPEEEVLPRLGIERGEVFNQFAFRRKLKELRDFYKDRNHYSPTIGPYTFSEGVLYLNVEPGKRFEAQFTGNRAVGTKKLRRALPFFEAEDVRDDLVNEAVERMRAVYYEEGYPFVQIAPVITDENETRKVSFFIHEGRKVKVASIDFRETSLDPERLKEIIASQTGKHYNPDFIEPDMESLLGFYQSLGYLDVSIKEETELGEKGMAITYRISEGPQYRIEKVEIEGVGAFPVEEARKAVGVKPGDIYNEVDILDSRQRLMDLYHDRGYADSSIEVRREFEGAKAGISFVVTEGGPLVFGKHVITGNRKTERAVIERELRHKENSPFNLRTLLAERQRLYELGLFSEVNTEVLDRHEGQVDVAYRVREAKSGSIELGVGYGDYEGIRGSLGLTYRNLFGMDRIGSARFEFSTLENRVILSYVEPYLFGSTYPFRVLLLREERKEKNIDTGEVRYRLERYTANAGTERKLSEFLTGELYYEFSLVKTFDIQPDVVLSREDVGTLAISALRPALTYDTRDNPFNPGKGILAGAVLKAASTALLSETNFAKLTLQANTYYRLSSRFILALSARFGVAEGFAGTEELPIVERFFLGGRNTVRGFSQDSLGPKSAEGTPVGGNAFALGNVELRTRVTRNWGLVFFVDSGNVYPKASDINLTDLRYTTGMGLRYNTPVGPLRLDYGRKLEREPDESRDEIHFSIGHAF